MAYCTIQDFRDEGYTLANFPDLTDARLTKVIRDATRFIDNATGRFFGSRDLTFAETWRGEKSMLLRHPIIAIEEMRFVNLDQTLQTPLNNTNDIRIFNRHVRQGLLDPDDRENPQIALIFVDPNLLLSPPLRPVTASEITAASVQQIQIKGTFGYTDPTFGRARAIASDAGDAITAPNTIKMTNGSFDADDVGHTITVAGSASTNDGNKTITKFIGTDTVEVKETLVTEASGFTATIVDFPQVGIIPPDIAKACLLLGIRDAPLRATADPLASAISGGRLRRMQTRDQAIDLSADPRIASHKGGSISGDPVVDDILIRYRRPLHLGRA